MWVTYATGVTVMENWNYLKGTVNIAFGLTLLYVAVTVVRTISAR
jgi:hypothetical protein